MPRNGAGLALRLILRLTLRDESGLFAGRCHWLARAPDWLGRLLEGRISSARPGAGHNALVDLRASLRLVNSRSESDREGQSKS